MSVKSKVINGKTYFEVYVQGSDSSGKRIQMRRRGLESLRAASQIEFELKRELANLKDQKPTFTFAEWFERCLSQMKCLNRPSTVINYNKMLSKWVLPHWKNIRLNEISRSDISSLLNHRLDPSLSPWTKRNILKMIRRIFQMAVIDGHLPFNPGIGIQVKVSESIQTVLTAAEAQTFLKVAKECNHRFYPVWVVALLTGMRSGELFALRWSDIDLEAQMIKVSRQWTNKNGITETKTGKTRMVPISKELGSFLSDYRLGRLQEEFVLPHFIDWENGEQAKVTREFCQAIGVTPVKFHDLRATFITNLLSQGEPLARVMAIVGHSQLKTTNVYLRKAGIEVFGATEKLKYRLS